MSNKVSYREVYPEKVHSFISLSFLIVSILLIFLTHSLVFQVFLFLITVSYFFYLGLNLKVFISRLLFSLFFSGFYFLMMIVFPSENSFFYRKSLIEAFQNFQFLNYSEFFYFFRLFVVSSLSILSTKIIHLEVILMFLVQKKYIKVSLAYPILFSINSIVVIRQKFMLYRLNHRLRKTKGWVLPKIMFQFIVFILRFSESGALSFLARGLSEDKLYYYDFRIFPEDQLK